MCRGPGDGVAPILGERFFVGIHVVLDGHRRPVANDLDEVVVPDNQVEQRSDARTLYIGRPRGAGEGDGSFARDLKVRLSGSGVSRDG